MYNWFICFRLESKTIRNLQSSTSTPNFDSDPHTYPDSSFGSVGGYQNFKDQKDAFFSKKQLENCGRPE
jgi:hypothetical protein